MEHHNEGFLRVYPERFAKEHGPLRPVVERVLDEEGREIGEGW